MVNYLVVKDKNYFSSFLDQAMVIAGSRQTS